MRLFGNTVGSLYKLHGWLSIRYVRGPIKVQLTQKFNLSDYEHIVSEITSLEDKTVNFQQNKIQQEKWAVPYNTFLCILKSFEIAENNLSLN